MLSRRSVVIAFGTSVLLGARGALAQPVSKPARIGFLRFSDQESGRPCLESFRQGLRNLGYAEGRHFMLEARFGDGRVERLLPLAEELIKRKVDLIVNFTEGQSKTAGGPWLTSGKALRVTPTWQLTGAICSVQ